MRWPIILFVLLLSMTDLTAAIILQGTVKNEKTGQAIIGANVEILDTQYGTFTDKEGYFIIKVEQDFPIQIKVSHIGFEPQEIQLDSLNLITIFLVPQIIRGETVEVLGDRPKYESDVSSAVDVIEIEAVKIQGARDLGSALRRVSGIKMDFSSSGKQTISIRGSNASDAVVFLDGIKLNDANTGVADLSAIDLNTLEQIQVIKGGNSILYGSGALGGVVNLQSKRAKSNSAYVNWGQGFTFEHDQDLSFGFTGVMGPLGVGSRYTGKSRAYGGRTVTTHIFKNIFAGFNLGSNKLDVKGYQLDKSLEFPSGGVTSSDGQTLLSLTYLGSLFGSSGWEILVGKRDWGLEQNFLTSLNESLDDASLNYQISKHLTFQNLEMTVQLEREDKQFIGDKKYFNIDGKQTVNHRAEMQRQINAIAIASRWLVFGDHPNMDLITFEVGMRTNRITTLRDEQFKFPSILQNGVPIEYQMPASLLRHTLSSKRVGVKLEGILSTFKYSLFINQGDNRRLPMLTDFFHFSNAGSNDYLDSTLTSESVSTTEINLHTTFNSFRFIPGISGLELDLGYFRNNYSNKIAYRVVEDLPPVPFNSKVADIQGVEAAVTIRLWNNRIGLLASSTVLDVSNPYVFPYKPKYRNVISGEVNLHWIVISYDHVSEGEQYFFIPGIGEGTLKPRTNANLNLTLRKKGFGLHWELAYTWRNMLTRDESDLSIEESLRMGFNYFEKYREIITLNVEF